MSVLRISIDPTPLGTIRDTDTELNAIYYYDGFLYVWAFGSPQERNKFMAETTGMSMEEKASYFDKLDVG